MKIPEPTKTPEVEAGAEAEAGEAEHRVDIQGGEVVETVERERTSNNTLKKRHEERTKLLVSKAQSAKAVAA